ncbi:MAG: zinc-binding dehydrogenase [Oscillospiraceae bacterium]|nr:zinc-binding dehydrogenase [Oscillospiraceae bacterium]
MPIWGEHPFRIPPLVSGHEVAGDVVAVGEAVTPETNIVVIGTGPIGIGDYLCSRLYNPKKIIMVDISDFNLEKTREMGAEYTVNSRLENLYDRVMELTDGVGADVTILAYGDEPTLQQAAEITRRAGTVVQHALMTDGLAFPYRVHQQHELDFKAYNMYRREDFELVANAIAEGKMDLSKFVTQRYPIEQFKEAMYMADKRPEPVLKVMVHF